MQTRLLFCLFMLLICTASNAQTKVVVVPMFDENKYPEPFSPVQHTSPRHSNYFIHSNRVVDEVTGLTWQREIAPFALNWDDAWRYCWELTIGDLEQWRLPEPNELISIVDFNERSPSINVNAFPGTNSIPPYWTSQFSSNFAGSNPSLAHVLAVDFQTGGMARHSPTASMRVRCVHGRSASRGAVLRDEGNGTVYDMATGLTWQRGHQYDLDWTEAAAFCDSLTLGGANDWRLPNPKELVSIADYRDPYLIHSGTWFSYLVSFIWSAQQTASNTSEAWVINIRDGGIYGYAKANNANVRCVR